MFSVFRVFCPVLNLSKGFLFEDTRLTDGQNCGRTDGRTRPFFGRQSEEALLVKQGKLSSNLTKLGTEPDTGAKAPAGGRPDFKPWRPALRPLQFKKGEVRGAGPASGREEDIEACNGVSGNKYAAARD